jgi:bifunctional DNA-binding transcriptional regulator/antitoxin component of YhaV-PrlF toxin-antitoxin module
MRRSAQVTWSSVTVMEGNEVLPRPAPDNELVGVTLTSMKEVKKRRRGSSRISSKHQVTIPVDALRAAGLEVGERVVARVDGPGRVVLERETDVIDAFAGSLTGTYDRDEPAQLRDEWA